jgi:hypothetical protein
MCGRVRAWAADRTVTSCCTHLLIALRHRALWQEGLTTTLACWTGQLHTGAWPAPIIDCRAAAVFPWVRTRHRRSTGGFPTSSAGTTTCFSDQRSNAGWTWSAACRQLRTPGRCCLVWANRQQRAGGQHVRERDQMEDFSSTAPSPWTYLAFHNPADPTCKRAGCTDRSPGGRCWWSRIFNAVNPVFTPPVKTGSAKNRYILGTSGRGPWAWMPPAKFSLSTASRYMRACLDPQGNRCVGQTTGLH